MFVGASTGPQLVRANEEQGFGGVVVLFAMLFISCALLAGFAMKTRPLEQSGAHHDLRRPTVDGGKSN